MKTFIVGLSMIAALGLQASDDIALNMKDMRDGLVQIQDGFLYNDKQNIIQGITKVENANKMFHDKKTAYKFLPKDKQKLAGIAELSSKNLNGSLEEMREYVKHNQIIEASAIHSDLVHNCTRCHAIVRGW